MIISTPFFHAIGSKPIAQKTEIEIARSSDGLDFIFHCFDDPYVGCNKFMNHNEPLWQQEVLEIFIAAGDFAPSRYLEFQINPNNAVFLANVFNPDGIGLNNELQMLNPDSYSICNQASIGQNNDSWSGAFSLPFDLLGGESEVFRMNIYRIIRTAPLQNSEWRCSIDNSIFATWQPLNNILKPAFHQSSSFVPICLV